MEKMVGDDFDEANLVGSEPFSTENLDLTMTTRCPFVIF